MVKKFLNYFHKEFNDLHHTALILAVAGMGADVLALFRDRLFASIFGAGRELDIYFAAFRVPDLIYTITLLFAANTAIIPILLKKVEQNEHDARDFFGGLMSVFLILTILLCGLAFIFMPRLASLIAPGFPGEDSAYIVLLSRIMLISPVLLGLSNLVSSIVQSYRRFFVYALSPLFYNLGIILGIILIFPYFGIAGLAWGVALGALLHLLIQLPSVYRLGFLPHLHFSGIWSDVLAVTKLSLPRTIGLSLTQLTMTVVTAMASLLASGSIAVFNLAQNLQSVPLSVVGLSYSVAAFPTLARLFVANRRDEFVASVSLALRHIIFWSVPVSVFFIVLRAQIVRVILGAGTFSWTDTRLTAAAFLLFSFSIISQSIVMLLVRAFYASGRTIMPLLINLVASAATLLLAVFLLDTFFANSYFANIITSALRVEGVVGVAVLVLPLAVSLGSIFNSLALLFGFYYIFGVKLERAYGRSLLEIVMASAAGGAVSYFILQFLAPILNLDTFMGIFMQGFTAGTLGGAVCLVMLRLMHNAEFMEIWEALHKRFARMNVVVAESESIK